MNYKNYINKLGPLLTPFETPLNTNDVIITKHVDSNLTAVVNNLEDFYSSVARGNEIIRRKYIIDKRQ